MYTHPHTQTHATHTHTLRLTHTHPHSDARTLTHTLTVTERYTVQCPNTFTTVWFHYPNIWQIRASLYVIFSSLLSFLLLLSVKYLLRSQPRLILCYNRPSFTLVRGNWQRKALTPSGHSVTMQLLPVLTHTHTAQYFRNVHFNIILLSACLCSQNKRKLAARSDVMSSSEFRVISESAGTTDRASWQRSRQGYCQSVRRLYVIDRHVAAVSKTLHNRQLSCRLIHFSGQAYLAQLHRSTGGTSDKHGASPWCRNTASGKENTSWLSAALTLHNIE